MADCTERGAWIVLGSLGLICLACSVDAWRQLGKGARLEVYGQRNSDTMQLEKGGDIPIEGDSFGAAVSVDLLPGLVASEDRRAREELAALIRRATFDECRPLPFQQSPPPEQRRPDASSEKPLDGSSLGAEAGASLPWFVSPQGITGISLLIAAVVGTWQRERLARGVKRGVEHVKTWRKKPPE